MRKKKWTRSPLILSLMKPKGFSTRKCAIPGCEKVTKFNQNGFSRSYCSWNCVKKAVQYVSEKEELHRSYKMDVFKKVYIDSRKGFNIIEIARKYHIAYRSVRTIIQFMKQREEE